MMEFKTFKIRYNGDTFVIIIDEKIYAGDRFILANGEVRLCEKWVMYPSNRIRGLKVIKDTLNGYHFAEDVEKIFADSSMTTDWNRFNGMTKVELAVREICPAYGGRHIGKDCSCKSGFVYVPILENGKIIVNGLWP